uniref:Uncharacterized protein LOC111127010 isoform X2 n=1 Tax=Crassostrea virginica TaxID=6565 RepID=A0A8B8DJB9_CRAVI|nr:uncharacterized protein LOC111127010 isoform X2 [Crassostrea virginica]
MYKMTHSVYNNLAILAWVVTFLLMIASGPMIYKGLVLKSEDLCSIDEELKELEFFKNCDFDNFKNTAWTLWIIVVASLGFVTIVSIVQTALAFTEKRILKRVLFSFVSLLSIASCVAIGYFFFQLYNTRFNPPKPVWRNLHFDMIKSLEQNFKSDNVNSNDGKSNEWNMLFFNFECCGVDNVYGTTNDFDTTSWCTTSGSCQKTNSQIPKSCCKNENEFDYETAHSNCHASVNPGTYHEKGSYSVIKREIKKRRKEVHKAFDDFLASAITVGMLMVTYGALEIAFLILVFCEQCKKSTETNPTTAQNHTQHSSTRNNTSTDTVNNVHEQINERTHVTPM